ncbi:hypothetical protein HDF18_26430 [Mucilaginibacter sp. X5P1]|uniref:ABC transporter permease/M1 family aminopeptidase n=1 Tax=Mucilaginibacter sp. X5P1 TaxID=2723088 RepID=UPI001614B13A|nr:hypothetical protein [Mucilaginibacter sp. X5P1]MBB6138605.1 hypothetical protein [Mucilaginibacter sp. X5P1]
MFWKIFLFEIQNRVRRPAMYLYFAAALIFTVGTFATGSLPLAEKEHINAPFILAMWCGGITMLMMVVSSSIMGNALYRDIEYNTKDYYLTYPITKAGYFWGRYFGSFAIMLFIASAIIIGAYAGTWLGPAMGWRDPAQYGPNRLIYYLHPFLTIALPNLIFTSSLFFGLVAITRNVKVIYSGGILLFLGYFLSMVFLSRTNNETVINLADPFGLNGVRLQTMNANSIQQNTTLISITGSFLLNRIIWTGVGLIVLLYTYFTFSFERFFSGKRDKAAIGERSTEKLKQGSPKVSISFTGSYKRNTLWKLTRMEISNIIRDNYFWIILLSGMTFLAFVLWMGDGNNGVADFPRTVMLLDTYNGNFLFFIFFIILFYTGEILHRDRVTRFAFINDSLPPPNWVLNGSKFVALLVFAFFLALIPLILGLPIQIIKGFYHFHFLVYFTYIFTLILPRLLDMVAFCYVIHVTLNNKFGAHAVAIFLWIIFFFLEDTGTFNYNLLMYSYTPWYGFSDMDGIGHMAKAVYSFHLFWLLFAGVLVIVSGLYYYRGVTSGIKERWQLVKERFDTSTLIITVLVFLAFLSIGAYNYYNVSYLNNYLTKGEEDNRAEMYERQLKKYSLLPLPKVTRMELHTDLYPDKLEEYTHAFVTIANKTNKPIEKLLLDGDELSDYSIKQNGKLISFTSPLLYPRGMFNWFRPKNDTAEFRLYQFQKALAPGDSTVLEINSAISYNGFSNGLYSKDLLHNGTFLSPELPGLGYDDDDELDSPYERKKRHLPVKTENDIPQNDPEGISGLKAGKAADLLKFDITVSTSGDQTAIAPGELVKQWKQGGRNYFHYVQDKPGMYAPLGILSARYAIMHDTVNLGHPVNINIYYHPDHNANLGRFMAAYKDGLRYFNKAYGNFPFTDIRLAESSIYGPRAASMTTLSAYAEQHAWNADFTDPNQTDYCYFNTINVLAQQWWRFQVAPNNTIGSIVIPEGLAGYSALVMAEKKYGAVNMRYIVLDQLWFYLFIRHRMEDKEHPLITADQWFEYQGKAAVVLYGLRDLMGEDSLNSALRDFKNAYAFKNKPPYAGNNDLYSYLQKHVPDSLQYYLTDTWKKITLYDNKVTEVKAKPLGKNNYQVTLTVNVNKVWIDGKGNDVIDKKMNDYIDIGIFAADGKNKDGRTIANQLYLKKYKLTAGQHTFNIIVKGKPQRAGIDPYNKLIDRMPNDNLKDL